MVCTDNFFKSNHIMLYIACHSPALNSSITSQHRIKLTPWHVLEILYLAPIYFSDPFFKCYPCPLFCFSCTALLSVSENQSYSGLIAFSLSLLFAQKTFLQIFANLNSLVHHLGLSSNVTSQRISLKVPFKIVSSCPCIFIACIPSRISAL